MKIRFTASLAVATATAVFAQNPPARPDITLSDGRVLHACKVMSSTPESLLILHAGGAETISFELLPENLRKAHGYDPAKAASHRAETEQAMREQQAFLEKQAAEAKARGLEHAEAQARRADAERTQIDAVIEVLQVVDGGILAKGYGKQGAPNYQDVTQSAQVAGSGLDAGRVVNRSWTERQDTRRLLNLGDRFFVVCSTDGIIDGQTVKAHMWPAGTYSYTNTMGARMTVRKFTTTPP